MLLAARALTFLADVFPPAAASIIRHGAVPAFCARLLTIEYIDLAEQSLQVGLVAELASWGLAVAHPARCKPSCLSHPALVGRVLLVETHPTTPLPLAAIPSGAGEAEP